MSPNPDIVPKGIHGKDGPSPSEPERALGPPPRLKPNREGAAPPGKSSFPASPRSPRSSLSGRPPPSPAGPQASGPRPVQNSDNFRRGNGLVTVDLSSIEAPGLGARSRRVIASFNDLPVAPDLLEDRRIAIFEPVLGLLEAIEEDNRSTGRSARRRKGSLNTSLVDTDRAPGLWPFGQAAGADYYTRRRPNPGSMLITGVGGNPSGGHAERPSSPSARSRPTATSTTSLTLRLPGPPLLHVPGAILGPQPAPVKEGGASSARNRPLDPGGWSSPPKSSTRPLRIP